MAEYDDMASFANMFSNSKSGGKMTKKKSAGARQKAKAKGMKGAAYIALGSPAGKKTKNSGGKSSSSKGSGSKGSGSSSSSKSKTMVNTGSPYATAAVSKAKAIDKAKAAGMNSAASIALGNPRNKQIDMGKAKYLYNSVAGIALGNPRTAQVRAKSKPATSSKPTTSTTMPKSTTSTTTPKFKPNVKPLKPKK